MVGIVDEQIQAAALERFGQLARVVAGQHDQGMCMAFRVPSSGTLTWKSLSTSSRKASNSASARSISSISSTVGLSLQDRAEQRARQQEAHREEDILFGGQPVGGLRSVRRVASRSSELIAQDLGVEQLLGVFPFVQRLGFVQPFVTLQADQFAAGGAGQAFASSVLPTPAGPSTRIGLPRRGQGRHGGNLVAGDVLLLSERNSDVVDAVEHSEFLSHWLNAIVRQKRHGCREEVYGWVDK